MYRLTFNDSSSNIQTNISSSNIIHDKKLELKISNIGDIENLLKSEASYDELTIYIKNNENIYSEVFSTEILDGYYDKTDLIIEMIENIFTESIFTRQLFKYLNLLTTVKNIRYWKDLSDEAQYCWLRACFAFNRYPKKIKTDIIIDGNFITSKNSFFCEFSEQSIGIGGYFGSDLDGFDDCFKTFYKNCHINKVIWKSFDVSNFNDKQNIIEILEDNNVQLIKN